MKFAVFLGSNGSGTMANTLFARIQDYRLVIPDFRAQVILNVILSTRTRVLHPGRLQTNLARYNNMMAPKNPYTICSSPIVSGKEFVTVGTFRPTGVD